MGAMACVVAHALRDANPEPGGWQAIAGVGGRKPSVFDDVVLPGPGQ